MCSALKVVRLTAQVVTRSCAMTQGQMNGRRTQLPAALVERARGEYMEMPGLRLTVDQACRLWQLDVAICLKVFDHLVTERFLRKTETGFYIAYRDGSRRD
jgi:hypothetical protein